MSNMAQQPEQTQTSAITEPAPLTDYPKGYVAGKSRAHTREGKETPFSRYMREMDTRRLWDERQALNNLSVSISPLPAVTPTSAGVSLLPIDADTSSITHSSTVNPAPAKPFRSFLQDSCDGDRATAGLQRAKKSAASASSTLSEAPPGTTRASPSTQWMAPDTPATVALRLTSDGKPKTKKLARRVASSASSALLPVPAAHARVESQRGSSVPPSLQIASQHAHYGVPPTPGTSLAHRRAVPTRGPSSRQVSGPSNIAIASNALESFMVQRNLHGILHTQPLQADDTLYSKVKFSSEYDHAPSNMPQITAGSSSIAQLNQTLAQYACIGQPSALGENPSYDYAAQPFGDVPDNHTYYAPPPYPPPGRHRLQDNVPRMPMAPPPPMTTLEGNMQHSYAPVSSAVSSVPRTSAPLVPLEYDHIGSGMFAPSMSLADDTSTLQVGLLNRKRSRDDETSLVNSQPVKRARHADPLVHQSTYADVSTRELPAASWEDFFE